MTAQAEPAGAELLREAAAKMREDWTGPGHIAETFRAVAGWLEDVERRAYGIGLPVAREAEIGPALAVARAYLGREA